MPPQHRSNQWQQSDPICNKNSHEKRTYVQVLLMFPTSVTDYEVQKRLCYVSIDGSDFTTNYISLQNQKPLKHIVIVGQITSS